MVCAPSEDSDQPGRQPSLIRVFAVRSMGSLGPKLSSCGQRRLWSDWADAQADLRLRWAHIPFYWLCHEAAHMSSYKSLSTKLFKVTRTHLIICLNILRELNIAIFSTILNFSSIKVFQYCWLHVIRLRQEKHQTWTKKESDLTHRRFTSLCVI